MADKLTDEQLVAIVNGEFDEALGIPNGDISKERAEAFRYYLSKKYGDEIEGESQVVTSEVSDVVDGIMPSLLRIFTTADNLIEFDPVGEEDIALASQESDHVNHVFFKQNPAFLILFFWFFDALLQKNGVVKAWWDESEEVTTESYENLNELEMLELLGDEELEVVTQKTHDAETVNEAGEIVVERLYDIEFKRVTKSGRACVTNVPPDEYRISRDANSVDPASARMVGHEREVTRSDLLAMGFDEDIVNELPAADTTVSSSEKVARQDKSDERKTSSKSRDKSQDKILLREAYIKVDADGDGRAELMQVFTANDKLLEKSPADRQPFHILCPHPLPHKHFGRSSAEKVMDLQKLNSHLWRQILTNLYHTNRPGHAVWEMGIGETTLDDLLTTRVGRVAKFARPVSESWQPITVPFTAKDTFPMVELVDREKRQRSGVSMDGDGLDPEALKHIQTGVYSPEFERKHEKIEMIARVFAETGIRSLFLHLHELLRKHQQKEEIVRLRNGFVPSKPSEWRTRMNMTVKVGLGIGTRQQNLIHYNSLFEKQLALYDRGLTMMVKPQDIFQTTSELVKNANLRDPNAFFTDPGDQEAPPPSKEQIELQKQQQQLAARQQQLDAQEQRLKTEKVQIDRQRVENDYETKLLEIQRKTEKDKDDLSVANEKLRNELFEMRLKYEGGGSERRE